MSDERFPIDGGMWAMKLLRLSIKDSRLLREPSSVGILPSSLLSFNSRTLSSWHRVNPVISHEPCYVLSQRERISILLHRKGRSLLCREVFHIWICGVHQCQSKQESSQRLHPGCAMNWWPFVILLLFSTRGVVSMLFCLWLDIEDRLLDIFVTFFLTGIDNPPAELFRFQDS